MCLTFNNFACYYRKLDKPRSALCYLEKVLGLEVKMGNLGNLGDTHMNLCGVLSGLKRHTEAL